MLPKDIEIKTASLLPNDPKFAISLYFIMNDDGTIVYESKTDENMNYLY